MAATGTRPATQLPPPLLRARTLAGRVTARPPLLLGGALAVAATYAAFASGSATLPGESRLQVFIAAVSIATVAALLFGRSLRATAHPGAYAGLALLLGFALWGGLSLIWSIAPDASWVEANRALAYSLVAGLALVLGASLPRAAERVAIGWLVLATAVALYALVAKVAPWIHDLEGGISRLRDPVGYWNSLALMMVMALPVALRVAVDEARSERARLLALLAGVPLLVAAVLALSRGALLVLAAALLVQLALSDDRRRLILAGGVVLVSSLPALLLGVTLHDLTTDNVAQSARVDDGLLLLAALVIGLVAVAALGGTAVRARVSDAGTGRFLGRGVLVAAAALLAIVLVVAALSEGGSSSPGQTSAAQPGSSAVSDPSRLLQANASHRLDWWREAVGAWSDEPLLGHGAGSFPLLHKLYRKDPVVDVKQAHSVPLEFLATTGLIGALLALGGLGLLFLAAARGALSRRDRRDRDYAVVLLVGAGAWGLASVIDWHWEIPAVTMPALAFLGLLAARPRDGAAPPSSWRTRPSLSAGRGAYGLGLAAVTAGLALAIASFVLPAIANGRSDDAFLAARTKGADLRKAAEQAEQAARLNPFAADPLLAGSLIAQQQGDAPRSAQLLREAADRQPDNPDVWYEIARLQVLYDNYPGAYRAASTALALDRGDDIVAAIFALLKLDERRSASATGTPLPKKLPRPAAVAPVAPSAPPTGTPTPSAPATPPPSTPAPTPAPAPAPQTPSNPNFRLEG
jgi:O-antigen ligase/polysaccharide polymerase Wzy-like membrane protein